MRRRVGITTNPGKTKRLLEEKHSNLRNWKLEGRYDNKTVAQNAQKQKAAHMDCDILPGSEGPEDAEWMVYTCDY